MEGQTRRVRIWYFNGDLSAEELQGLCERNVVPGSVQDVCIEYDDAGYTRCTAVVRMDTARNAKIVYERLNEVVVKNWGVKLQTAFVDDDELVKERRRIDGVETEAE